jgi:predicted permease
MRIALRQHTRQPAFAVTVILTLAVTIGATTAVFSVVNAVLIRALPFASPDRLLWIASVRAENANAPFSLPEFMDYRAQTRAVSDLAAYANWTASLAGDDRTERLQGARMSGNAFDVLGVAPSVGRLLTDSDDRPDAPAVVVLSHRLWQRRYGGRADVVGRAIRINTQSFTVVGVLPARFPLPLPDIDVITPLAPARDPLRHVRNSVNFLRVFGRLTAGADPRAAEAELTAICRSLRQQFPVEYARKDAVRVTPFGDAVVGKVRSAMLILFAAVIVVLATALSNLVSLSLVRASRRAAELSLRVAIGASRWQLARQLAVEALALTAIGSALGCALAAWAIRAASVWAPPSIPRLDEVSLSGAVVLFAIVVSTVVTTVLAMASLAAMARTQAGSTLRLASRGAVGDRWSHRVRNVMVVSQIAAALVLLLATVALVQSLYRLQELNPGFDPDRVFQARVSIPPTYVSANDVARFYDRLFERLIVSPGVTHVGVISAAPLSGLLAAVPFSVAGRPVDERERVTANYRAISPGYLSTVGTRLLEGRGFAETDRSDTPQVALVSAALADRLLSGRALGQRLLINDNNVGPRPVEVVGVVDNVRHTALDLPPELDIYVPLRQFHQDWLSALRNNHFWMVQTDADPAAFAATFLAHLRTVDPDAAVSGAGAMRQSVDAWLGPRRFTLGLFGAFALTAVFLAIVGLYGLVSYAVSQRTAEFGLRMAIGATPGDVQRMVFRQAALLGLVGSAVGAGLAAATWPLIAGFVHDVAITPPFAVATSAGLVGVVLMAGWLPARRAARVEPTVALRAH